VGPHHAEGLLDAQVKGAAHLPRDMPTEGTQATCQRASGLHFASRHARRGHAGDLPASSRLALRLPRPPVRSRGRRPAALPTPVERSYRPSAMSRPGWLRAPGRSAGLKATNKKKSRWERIPEGKINKIKNKAVTKLQPASSPPRELGARPRPPASG
jgi:hypothetical protein